MISPLIIEWTITYLVQMLMIVFAPELLEDAVKYTMIVSMVIIPVMYILYKRDRKYIFWAEGDAITSITILSVTMLGVVLCTGMNIFIGITGLAEYSEKYQEVSLLIYDSPMIVQAISVVIIAPIVEELVYRGLLYRRMRNIGPVFPAVIISALVFGINHGNLVQFVFAAAIGIILALAYEKYRNIMIPIILHVSVNLTSLIWTWLAQIN